MASQFSSSLTIVLTFFGVCVCGEGGEVVDEVQEILGTAYFQLLTAIRYAHQ